MKIENQKVVKAIYEMYVDGEEGKEEMIDYQDSIGILPRRRNDVAQV